MSSDKEIHQHRKDEHLSLAVKYWLNREVQLTGKILRSKMSSGRPTSNGLDKVRLIPNGLPELSLSEIDISTELFGHRFEKPFYIEAITGGSERGDKVNAQLAEIAKNQHLAMAVGSQSIALKYPELAAGFARVREIYKDGFLFANLGAGHSLENAKRAVDMIKADALELHINVAQELTMKNGEGDQDFYWLDNINEIATKLDVPVIVKEVGFGMNQRTFKQLAKTNVTAVNVGGAGGTNFAWIENQRAHQLNLDNFGLNLVESLLEAKLAGNQKPLIATGGISSAEEIVKTQMLGATLSSSAGVILKELIGNGIENTELLLESWQSDLKKLYLLLCAQSFESLSGSYRGHHSVSYENFSGDIIINDKIKSGKIIESAECKNIREHERKTARAFAEAGYMIEFIPESKLDYTKSPDFLIDGKKYEVKSPSTSRISHFDKILAQASKQSNRIIIDSQKIKAFPDSKIQMYLISRFPKLKNIKQIIFVNKKREIIDISSLL